MSSLAVIFDVMFAMYLMGFITGFQTSLTEGWTNKAKISFDVIIGIVLLIAVVIANQ